MKKHIRKALNKQKLQTTLSKQVKHTNKVELEEDYSNYDSMEDLQYLHHAANEAALEHNMGGSSINYWR